MGSLSQQLLELISAHAHKPQLARRLVEHGLTLVYSDLPPSVRVDLHGRDGLSVIVGDNTDELVAAVRYAGEMFDGYARHHLAKATEGPERVGKAERNMHAAVKMFTAIGEEYTPPSFNDRFATPEARQEDVQRDSSLQATGSALKLLSDLHIAEIAGNPILGIDVHVDDRPALETMGELGYLKRDDVSDKVTLTTKGKDAIGVRPAGVPDLPVEVAEVTGNIEERELAARYIDAKIKGVENYVAANPASAERHDYEVLARVLIEIAHEFRIGLHLPTRVVEGRVVPYNEDRSTGMAHAASLRPFFEDVYARNLKAGWWTDIETGQPKKRSVGELFMLFVTEIAEAYFAYRAGANDDKLSQFPGLGVELADLGIRWADFCGAYLAGNIVEPSGAYNPGDEMFRRVAAIAEEYEAIRKTPEAVGTPETGNPLPTEDVAGMVDAKLAFNAKRADHKIENRLKADGKKT